MNLRWPRPVPTLSQLDQGRRNNMDLMRLVAAAAVICSHSYPLLGRDADEPLRRLTGFITLGTLSVAVFFVISGYLVTRSMLGSANLLRFAKARARRIFPALVVATLLCVVPLGLAFTTLSPLDYLRHPSTWEYAIRNISLLKLTYALPGVFEDLPYPNVVNGSMWTLPVEVRLYVLVALLFGIGRWLGFIRQALISGTILALVATYLGSRSAGNWAVLVPYFLFGSLACLWRKHWPSSPWVSLVLVVASVALRETPMFRPCFDLALTHIVLLLALPASESLCFAGFGRMGDFSYGTYLYGFPVQQSIIAVFGASALLVPWQLSAIAVPLTVLLGASSWHVVEKHALGRRRGGQLPNVASRVSESVRW